ncbi:MAG: sensor histidine kinase [Desulfitobacteriaceae bacterium]
MSYKKVWLLALAALLFSVLLMSLNLRLRAAAFSDDVSTHLMSTGWHISDGAKTLAEAAPFEKVGTLKQEQKIVLSKRLPATVNQSLCFVTIGYRVEAFVDNQSFYTFGSSLDSKAVWGVKTHLFKIPNGQDGRELRLVFSTNQPEDIAVSQYVLSADAPDIIRTLQKADLINIGFALFYMSIGFFLLISTLVSTVFRKFDLSVLMLALIPLLIGTGIFFNFSIVAFYTRPEAVYWIVNLINLALPVPTLLFVAVDRGWSKSRLLLALAVIQSVFLALWVICNLLEIDFFLNYWFLVLFAAILVSLIVTFMREFRSGNGRPEIAISVITILLTSVLNAYSYFTPGNHDSMDFSLIILAFPVLVLMTGKVVLSSAQREYQITNENMTLRIEGELLYNNYNKIDKYIEETKRIWHDIDKHFAIISSLAGDEEYEELQRYLAHTGYELKKTKNTYLCENKLINAILTDKISEAESCGINVYFTGNLPAKLNIQGNDLCSLLVNMLDNAIEACDKLPHGKEKKIDISIRMKNDFIYFGVLNSSAAVPVMVDEEFVSSKEDKAKHGYGIAIMRNIARKYDGTFDVVLAEHSFLVKAALKNAPAPSTDLKRDLAGGI